VEAQFTLRNVTSLLERYYLVMTALLEDQVDCAQAIVEAEVTAESYTKLRVALLATHTLNPYQQGDLLANMDPLGRWKPSSTTTTVQRAQL
jgi:hypothetical protein